MKCWLLIHADQLIRLRLCEFICLSFRDYWKLRVLLTEKPKSANYTTYFPLTSQSPCYSGCNLDVTWAMTHSHLDVPAVSYIFIDWRKGRKGVRDSSPSCYLVSFSLNKPCSAESSPHILWAKVPPGPQASWREPRRMEECAPSENTHVFKSSRTRRTRHTEVMNCWVGSSSTTNTC